MIPNSKVSILIYVFFVITILLVASVIITYFGFPAAIATWLPLGAATVFISILVRRGLLSEDQVELVFGFGVVIFLLGMLGRYVVISGEPFVLLAGLGVLAALSIPVAIYIYMNRSKPD